MYSAKITQWESPTVHRACEPGPSAVACPSTALPVLQHGLWVSVLARCHGRNIFYLLQDC